MLYIYVCDRSDATFRFPSHILRPPGCHRQGRKATDRTAVLHAGAGSSPSQCWTSLGRWGRAMQGPCWPLVMGAWRCLMLENGWKVVELTTCSEWTWWICRCIWLVVSQKYIRGIKRSSWLCAFVMISYDLSMIPNDRGWVAPVAFDRPRVHANHLRCQLSEERWALTYLASPSHHQMSCACLQKKSGSSFIPSNTI